MKEGRGRTIKRYDNRKLYDVAERRYVTLDELRDLVAEGEEVTVLDQKTGDDLTSLTLAQILLEGLRQGAARIPRSLLVELVRLQAAPGPGKPWPTPKEAAQRTREEAEKIVARLLARGRLSLDEAITLRHDIVQSVGHLVSEAQAGLESGIHRLFGGPEGAEAGGGRGRAVAPKRQGTKAKRPAARRKKPGGRAR